MDLVSLVLGDGDQAQAQARLAARGGRFWLSPWPAEHYAPGSDRGPYEIEIDAAGDAAGHVALSTSGEVEVAGWAELTGTWLDGFVLTSFQPASPPPFPGVDRTVAPCPAPAGGWPRERPTWWGWPSGFEGQRVLTALMVAGLVTSRIPFRPGGTRYAYVVAATDVKRVEADLRPHLGAALAVLPSRYTAAQYDEVRENIARILGVDDPATTDHTLLAMGAGSRADGQHYLTLLLSRVTPAFAEYAGEIPEEMLELDVLFTPPDPAGRNTSVGAGR